MRFLLLTGLSGAGKTSALRYLEDMGVLCVDNLPPMMAVRFMEACQSTLLRQRAVAFAMDVRSGAFFDIKQVAAMVLETRKLGYRMEIVYLEAADDALVARYKETRREHPLADDSTTLSQAIERERAVLQPLREAADHVIDTTGMKPRGLRDRLRQIVNESAEEQEETLRVEVMSFGFKRGLPHQADLVFDVRFLPNPFYIPELAPHTGLEDCVRDFVLGHDVTREFLNRVTGLLDYLIPHYQEEGKRRIVIAIGCTGGAHRSVAIAEAIGRHLTAAGLRVRTSHRDVDLEQARILRGEDE
ncbi:MAG: RNase adapter RapZ [Clostridia bacterium]|nr:RNase adapter RapZ [Clostridia bacterium]